MADALPPEVCRVQDPEWLVYWERVSMAVLHVKEERENRESVKEYLGRGRPCWAITMV